MNIMEQSGDLQEFRKQWENELLETKTKSSNSAHSNSSQSQASQSQDPPILSHSQSILSCDTKCTQPGIIEKEIPPDIVNVQKNDTDSDGKLPKQKIKHPAFRDELSSYTCKILSNNSASDRNPVYYPFAIVGNLLNSSLESPCTKSLNTSSIETIKIEQGPKHKSPIKSHAGRSNKKLKLENIFTLPETKSVQKERFLDKFIEDLNEINEIPFFDISIPKEVAVKIFQNLDMQDLCACAMVSKSWKYIAEDELLWYKVYHKLGYSTKKSTIEKTRWKDIVKKKIERKNLIIQNWKGRIGKLSALDHVPGGILCAVDSSKHNVVAGYSSGVVKLWNLATESEFLLQPSNISLRINTEADEGTLNNYVSKVRVSDNVIAAAYCHGNVDIWGINTSAIPTQTVQCKRPPIHQLCVDKTGSHIAIAGGCSVQTYSADNKGHFVDVETVDMPKIISHLKLLEDVDKQVSLVTATDFIVSLFPIGRYSNHVTEIHNMIGAPVTCIECRTEPNQIAVALQSCIYGGLHEGYKINVYDLNSGRQLTVLHGHTWIVSCMNMTDSTPGYLVTGSADRKVRVYDLRSDVPTQIFSGHTHKITTVQMDDWKVVSGGEDGFVRVWDQRMSAKLWELHNRHPVRHCNFRDNQLVVGNVPIEKCSEMDEFETVTHRRYRGSIQVYDFLSNQTAEGLPDICLSTYDEPHAYNYSIRLAMPYDSL